MYTFMFDALQYAAKKSGYMLFHCDDGRIAVADLVNERLVGIEPDLDKVADLLGGIAVYTAEQRKARKKNRMATVIVDKNVKDLCLRLEKAKEDNEPF